MEVMNQGTKTDFKWWKEGKRELILKNLLGKVHVKLPKKKNLISISQVGQFCQNDEKCTKS